MAHRRKNSARPSATAVYSGPLDCTFTDGGYADDPNGGWFWPMMNSVTASDFSFLDLEHYYQFSSVPEKFQTDFPDFDQSERGLLDAAVPVEIRLHEIPLDRAGHPQRHPR